MVRATSIALLAAAALTLGACGTDSTATSGTGGGGAALSTPSTDGQGSGADSPSDWAPADASPEQIALITACADPGVTEALSALYGTEMSRVWLAVPTLEPGANFRPNQNWSLFPGGTTVECNWNPKSDPVTGNPTSNAPDFTAVITTGDKMDVPGSSAVPIEGGFFQAGVFEDAPAGWIVIDDAPAAELFLQTSDAQKLAGGNFDSTTATLVAALAKAL
jgi:hypothetical protein